MQRLIDTDKLIKDMQYYHDDCAQTSEYTRLGFETAIEVVKNAPTVLIIPEQPTNGDIQKALYPNAKIMETNDGEIGLRLKGQNWIIWFKENWWNAPFKNVKGD